MTTTVKINPRELLSRLANSKSSGCLKLDEGLIAWKVYLQQGHLRYIDCSIQLLDQLKYHLYYLGGKHLLTAFQSPSFIKIQSSLRAKDSQTNLYSRVISWLITKNYLDSPQTLKLVENIIKDELQSCLWLNRGTFSWYEREEIPFLIQEQLQNFPSISISESLTREQIRLKQWQKCSTKLLSIHQRPYLASGWKEQILPNTGSLDSQTLDKLTQVIRGHTSIRQLSLLLHKDELRVAQILSPYIDHKIIFLRNARPPLDLLPNIPRLKKNVHNLPQFGISNHRENPKNETANTLIKTRKIVCIDDSPTILTEIQRFLDRKIFEVTAINDPVQAVPLVFRIKPDLILLDITMPRINGYKLCGLLRGSEQCDHIPIIMVTGNTGLIDKARAKIAGATDYLTKPFSREELREIVNKYIN